MLPMNAQPLDRDCCSLCGKGLTQGGKKCKMCINGRVDAASAGNTGKPEKVATPELSHVSRERRLLDVTKMERGNFHEGFSCLSKLLIRAAALCTDSGSTG